MTQREFEDSNGRITFLRTASTTHGELHEQRVEYVPGSRFPPLHFHPDQDEHFVVEQGTMLFVVDGQERVVGAGGAIAIPRRTPHQARNASHREPVVVRWATRPALRTGDFFLTAHRLGEHAGPLMSSLLAFEYRDVFRLSGVKGAAVPVLAGCARLMRRQLPSPW